MNGCHSSSSTLSPCGTNEDALTRAFAMPFHAYEKLMIFFMEASLQTKGDLTLKRDRLGIPHPGKTKFYTFTGASFGAALRQAQLVPGVS